MNLSIVLILFVGVITVYLVWVALDKNRLKQEDLALKVLHVSPYDLYRACRDGTYPQLVKRNLIREKCELLTEIEHYLDQLDQLPAYHFCPEVRAARSILAMPNLTFRGTTEINITLEVEEPFARVTIPYVSDREDLTKRIQDFEKVRKKLLSKKYLAYHPLSA